MGRRLERDNIGSHKLSLGPGLTHGLSSGSVTHLMVIFQVTKCISEIDIRSWPNFQIGSLAFKIYLLKQQFTHPASQARYQNIKTFILTVLLIYGRDVKRWKSILFPP